MAAAEAPAAAADGGAARTVPQDLLALLWRRRWPALAAFVAVLGTVAVITAASPRIYEATAYMLVNPNRPTPSDFEQTQISQALLTTYAQLMQTQNLADEVSRRLPPGTQIGNPRDSIQVDGIPSSQLLKVTGEARDPRTAQVLTNTYTQVFQDHTQQLADAQASAGHASIAEPATLPGSPARPRPKLYLAVGALLAALCALGAALLAQRLDQRLEISDSMTEVLGLPIIGRIPEGSTSGLEQLLAGQRPQTRDMQAAAEAFLLLLANLSFANMGQRPRTVAVVSSDEQEGKSTVALSLGRAAGELDIATLLVEADLRRPSLAAKAGGWIGSRLGFSTVLVRRANLSEVAWPLPESSMDLLRAGPLPPNPAALLGSEVLRSFDAEARERYGLVIYDTPPLSVAADASLVSAIAEGVVLVVDPGRTKRKLAAQAVDQLRRAQANVLGVVVNRVDTTPYSSGYYAAGPVPDTDHEAALAPAEELVRRAERPADRPAT